jgi:hypothetical protein
LCFAHKEFYAATIFTIGQGAGARLKENPLRGPADAIAMYRRNILAADGQTWSKMFEIMNGVSQGILFQAWLGV